MIAHSCLTCGKNFKNAGALSNHYRTTGHDPDEGKDEGTDTPGRRAFTWKRKRDVLKQYDQLVADGVQFPQKKLARMEKIGANLISRWRTHEREQIFREATQGDNSQKNRAFRDSVGTFARAEDYLYGRFLKTRRVDRLSVSHEWLREQMMDIVHRINPDHADDEKVETFIASVGWCIGFNKRWNITSQCRTNKHTESVEERLPKISSFHRWLIYELQARGPQRCPIYGRFPPEYMFHFDQIPLPFSAPTVSSMNPKGEKCDVKTGGKGSGSATKRYATVQLCICAAPDKQVVKVVLIFKGKGQLRKTELDELRSYANLEVRFQESAWADERIIVETLESFREATLHLGEVLLGMDGHTSQITPYVRSIMDYLGIRYAITTPNCTDIISPVDRHVGSGLKRKIFLRFRRALRVNHNLWVLSEKEGGLSETRKRLLIARWVSESWEEICAHHPHLIRQAFVETGFLLAKDGSENHKVHIAQTLMILVHDSVLTNGCKLPHAYDQVRPYKKRKERRKKGEYKTQQTAKHSYTNVSPAGVPYTFGRPDEETRTIV